MCFLHSYSHFLLLRFSVFISAIFRELQSDCSFFTPHQMFMYAYWLSVRYCEGAAVGLRLPEYGANKYRKAYEQELAM